MRWGFAIRLAFSLALLAATPAWGQDLAELRASYPGEDLVVLEQNTSFDLVEPDRMRVSFERRVFVLQDGGRERLALFSQNRRPGCREPREIAMTVTARDGTVTTLDPARIAEVPRSDTVLGAEAASVDLKTPRPGLAPGSLLEESYVVDYPAGCFGGLISVSRDLGDAWGPVVRETVSVSCAGEGCHASLDRPLTDALETGVGGLVLVRTDVPATSAESWRPARTRPRIVVSTSPDPLEAARILADALPEAVRKATPRLASYAAEAKRSFATEGDAAARTARMLQALPVAPEGAFWGTGFRWGAVPAFGDRPLLPLEWWALAVASLNSAQGVPVLVDRQARPTAPTVGDVPSYTEVGVLVPGRFLVTARSFTPLTEGGAPGLSTARLLRVDSAPEVLVMPASAAHDARVWTGEVELLAGNYVRYDLSAELRGAFGGRLRGRYLASHQASEKRKGKKKSEAERERRWVGQALLSREVAIGEVTEVPKRLDALDLRVVYTREGATQEGEGVLALALPLPVEPTLARVVATAERIEPFGLFPVDESFDLLIKPPAGYRAGGLPAARAVDAGPVSVELEWLPEGRNARMRLRYRVGQGVVGAELAEEVGRAADLLRDATRAWVVFVKE